MDVRAHTERPVLLAPLGRALIPTGISISLPEGYEAEMRPRSGLAIEFGVTVLNAPGTIDADYRGEVKVILINLGGAPFEVRPVTGPPRSSSRGPSGRTSVRVERLPETERGAGGFGSTGRSEEVPTLNAYHELDTFVTHLKTEAGGIAPHCRGLQPGYPRLPCLPGRDRKAPSNQPISRPISCECAPLARKPEASPDLPPPYGASTNSSLGTAR